MESGKCAGYTYYEHEEEDDGPDGAAGQLEHDLGVGHEDQARARVHN